MKTYVTFLLFCISVSFAFAQSTHGVIKGQITEHATGDPVPFAKIIIYASDSSILTGAASDFDGKFTISAITPGKYSIEIKSMGYTTKRLAAVLVNTGKITFLNETLSLEAFQIHEISAVTCKASKSPMSFSKRNRRISRKKDKVSAQSPQYSADAPDYSQEKYAKNKPNQFNTVKRAPLSTFSIDVDKAGYSNVRRFLNERSLPPSDAVRIEEMVNYFDYSFPQPTDDKPFSVHTEYTNCPWNETHQLVHIGIQGKKINLENAPSSNLVFLIDVSGSMSAYNKLALLKDGMNLLVDQLRPEDNVSIVVYAGAAGVVLPPTKGNKKQRIKDAINRLSSGGSTAGGEGINLAYDLAKKHFKKNGNNRVILATDGDFNVGTSSEQGLEELIESKRKEDIFLTVLGFGTGNYQDSKMEILADKGNGNYAYIDNILEAKKVLVKEMGGTLYTIAKDVKIQIEFNPKNVKAYKLIGYENRLLADEDFNDDTKDAGELGAGHTVTAIYEIIPANSTEIISNVDPLKYQEAKDKPGSAMNNELMTLKLRYKEPKGTESMLIQHTLTSTVTPFKETSENCQFSAAVAEFGLILRDHKFKENASYESVLKIAKAVKGEDKEGYRAEFIRLVETAELIDKRELAESKD